MNIIDTPGIGPGIGGDSYEEGEQDQENIDRILDHISRIKEIHAICILLNSNRARLGVVFRFLEHLHRDTAPNIVFSFTHIRGNLLMPGETIPTLRQELIDREVAIELNRNKMYCFDNEPFQYLMCVHSGIKFPDEDFEVFSAGWSRAVREQDRMLEHISNLRPRLSLENIRSQVFLLTSCLTEIGAALQDKMREVKEAEVIAKLAESEASHLEMEMESLCRKIKGKLEVKYKMEAAVDELNNFVKEFEIEEEEVLRVGATCRSFLKDSAIVPYNDDDLGDYLDETIQQEYEKQSGLRDEDLISRLKKSKMFYEEEKTVIEMALREFGNRKGFTREQMEEVGEDLFKMKHFGQSLHTTFSNVDRESKEADCKQKKLVHSGRGWKSKESAAAADGKDVQVRRVRMAKGQQEEQRREAQKAAVEAQKATEEAKEAAEETNEAKEAAGEATENRDERSERRERREMERSQYELRSKWRFDIKEDEDDVLTIV